MIVSILKQIQAYINRGRSSFSEHILGCRSFKNSKKLPLSRLITLIMSGLGRSLQIELMDYCFKLERLDEISSTSSFVQSRAYILPSLFEELNTYVLSLDELHLPLQKSHGYRLLGVDGTTLSLPQTKNLGRVYGYQKNQYCQHVMGRVLVSYDLLNGQCVGAKLDAFHKGERELCRDWVKAAKSDEVRIYDRNFGGYAFQYRHQYYQTHYVIRLKRHFNHVVKAFEQSGQEDEIVYFNMTQKALKELRQAGFEAHYSDKLKVRLVKVVLPSGEIEILATNLFDKKLISNELLAYWYELRWGIEGFIDVLKNKLQIEVFSAHKPQFIAQDFQAAICRFNFCNLMAKCVEQQLREQGKEQVQRFPQPTRPPQQDSSTKNYKLNLNLLIGVISAAWPLAMEGNEQQMQLFEQMINLTARFLQPVRKGRKFPRKFKAHKKWGRYYTHTNYRRAS